ncbi:MAG: ArsR family transcriptional regulator [Pyrinomonadaceae bacterium]
MKATKFGKNFFDSTRGRVLKLLRRGVNTVDDLSKELNVTDNAVRAHLITLERDGLVERSGMEPGFRKPHVSYEVTADAEQLFPKAYPALLNKFLEIVKQRVSLKEFEAILGEVARSLAQGNFPSNEETKESRIERSIETLRSMGGASALVVEGDRAFIRCTTSCPFDISVSEHPEVCSLAETLLSEVAGLEFEEQCQKGDLPKCSFEIMGCKE